MPKLMCICIGFHQWCVWLLSAVREDVHYGP